ncbi:MAG TPA: hypothetical protein VIH59_00190 [Candidatus Tectomicrobia bacterium]
MRRVAPVPSRPCGRRTALPRPTGPTLARPVGGAEAPLFLQRGPPAPGQAAAHHEKRHALIQAVCPAPAMLRSPAAGVLAARPRPCIVEGVPPPKRVPPAAPDTTKPPSALAHMPPSPRRVAPWRACAPSVGRKREARV